jgi:hypothetical protein
MKQINLFIILVIVIMFLCLNKILIQDDYSTKYGLYKSDIGYHRDIYKDNYITLQLCSVSHKDKPKNRIDKYDKDVYLLEGDDVYVYMWNNKIDNNPKVKILSKNTSFKIPNNVWYNIECSNRDSLFLLKLNKSFNQ